MPVNHDRTVSSYEWEEGIFTFKWNGRHDQDQLMEGVKKISQNETTENFLNDFSFCALARLYETIFKKQWYHLTSVPHCGI